MDKSKRRNRQDENLWKYYDEYIFSIFWQSTTCKKENEGYHCYNAIENFSRNIWKFTGFGLVIKMEHFQIGAMPKMILISK